jgi:ParB-like chromosome segregation protein Spo0J
MKAKDLKPDKRNPRKITQTKLDMLKKSLIEFGDISCIVFNKRTGVLISGHQRLKVIPEEAEIIIERTFDVPTDTGTTAEGYIKLGTENIKYREVDVDLKTQKVMNIAANKHGGEFDLSVLSELLLETDAENIDMELTGFTEMELENFLAPLEKEFDPDAEDEEDDKKIKRCPHCDEII